MTLVEVTIPYSTCTTCGQGVKAKELHLILRSEDMPPEMAKCFVVRARARFEADDDPR